MSQPEITIPLTKDEAIVLYEFLYRHDKSESNQLFIDQAEQRVFWDLICILEKQVIDPMLPNYEQVVANAREHVRDKE